MAFVESDYVAKQLGVYTISVPILARAAADATSVELLFRAPTNITITDIQIHLNGSLTNGSNANYRQVTFAKRQATGGTGITSTYYFRHISAAVYTSLSFTLVSAYKDLAFGDRLYFINTKVGSGTAFPGGLAVIQYICSPN